MKRGGPDSSELRHGLQMANHPTVGSRRHKHNVMRHNVFLMDQFSAIQDLKFILGRVVQLYDVALGGIKHGLHFVILIDVLLAQAGALLVGNTPAKRLLGFSGECTFQRIESIELQGLSDARPTQIDNREE